MTKLPQHNVMIDIETLAMPTAERPPLITSIGACYFDTHFGKVLDTGHWRVDLERFDTSPFRIDATTVKWWLSQPAEAQAEVRCSSGQGDRCYTLEEALDALNRFCKRSKKLTVWANPPSFDLVAIRQCMTHYYMKPVWHYRDEACSRTALRLAPLRSMKAVPQGIEHNAKDDAIRQALTLMTSYGVVAFYEGSENGG